MQQPRPRRKATFPLRFYLVLGGLVALALWGYDTITGEITGSYPLLYRAIMSSESQGQTMVGSVNRAQQAYVLEHGKLATTLKALEGRLLPVREGAAYRYQLLPQADPQLMLVTADPTADFAGEGLKHYRGAVKLITLPSGKRETQAILCKQTRPRRSWLYGTPKPLGLPFYSPQDQQLHCGEGSKDPE
ncbi:MAG: type IV pilin-like G/H family protein (plasmid) [Leptolyngbya sp. BL-A-14]